VRMAQAQGRVLAARAAEAEAKLSFTVLTDLLQPALNEVAHQLPAPQRRALEAALLVETPKESSRPDARAVSLATLGAFRALAAQGPVMLAIDDVQWTDAPSARALAFALRRFVDERITVVIAKRSAAGSSDPQDLVASLADGVERLTVGPLPPGPLGRMLRHRLNREFPPPLVRRIHEASGGNPFFALEISRALVRSPSRPQAGEPLPVPPDLHALVSGRLQILSADAREALLVAAASATPTAELLEAVTGSDLALEEAARAGVVTIRGSAVEFTHPLLASTVYADAAPSSRRTVHQRLAAASTDPEQKARHLALASSGPSLSVAAALDSAAVQARGRGAPQTAAELSELAVGATPVDDLVSRQRRMQMQAGNLFDAGDPRRARAIIEELIPMLEPGPARAEALFWLSSFAWKDLGRVSELLHQALEEAGEEHLRSQILSDLAWIALDMGEFALASDRAEAAVDIAASLTDNAYALRHALSILALALGVRGRECSQQLDRAVALEDTLALADLSSPATCLGRYLAWVGDLDQARRTLESELNRYREQGHETACYEILAHLADVEQRAGRYERASRHLDEADDIAAEAGVDVLGEILPVRAAVACSVGDVEDASRYAIEGLAVCKRTMDRWNEVRCRSVLGFLNISRDDPAAAHDWLGPLPQLVEEMGLREPGAFPFLPDEVEALVSLGEVKAAERLTDRLEEQGRASDRPLALATAARCRGLIAAARGDQPTSMEAFARATEQHARLPMPFELGRTLLVLGQAQRRLKQRRAGAASLRAALETFEALEAPLWADKARAELARTGGQAGPPGVLTPTEQRVAELVAEGHTNREVADALFVSVKTVEANLSRIFHKLGIRSRRQLRDPATAGTAEPRFGITGRGSDRET
jgi:DNA-binding CsgD family transcriptional regulator/tetratricopeptide (TPR) repeat protein